MLKQDNWISPAAVYQFFPAQSEGNKIFILIRKTNKIIETFDFPRQESAPYLCLADFVKSVDSGVKDYVGFFTVTAGRGIREKADNLKQKDVFLRVMLFNP